jgi:FKBP-type peptidyl-prolyl cis-trans isomerase SlyD
MKIEKNKMVSLIYELRENNSEGKIIEALEAGNPLKFVFGTGKLLPEFESNISSLGKGDNFSFILNSENAYGEKREDMIIDVPVSVFMRNGKIDEEICRTGNVVPMTDSEGHQITGVICEIGESYVKMDFNHPMAGLTLAFTGKIIDVRTATDHEIAGTAHSCSSCGSHGNEAGCEGSCSN